VSKFLFGITLKKWTYLNSFWAPRCFVRAAVFYQTTSNAVARCTSIDVDRPLDTMVFTKEQRSAFAKTYDQAHQCKESDTMLVKLKDEMIKMLLTAGEAKVKHVHCKSMAPHPQNRGNSKIQYQKIYLKGSKIISVGVSLTKCGPDAAVAFEENPKTKHITKSHIAHCKTSKHFAQYDETIECGSVGCGHWNQMLACIHDSCEVPKEFQKKLCEQGRTTLDADRLCRSQPVLRGLLDDGLKVTVIRYAIEEEFPKLPSVIQKALNIEHHIGEGP
jgi:hypothetical protein